VAGNATLAMVSIIVVNTWRGIPFYGITLSPGSRRFRQISTSGGHRRCQRHQRFWHVTCPSSSPS